jgi:hypothetical protein
MTAHWYKSAAHPGKEFRSTRGFAAGAVIDGKTIHPDPALDIQPRESSVAKTGGGPPKIHSHMASRTNTTLGAPPHPNYGPDASSANPLDPSQAEKRLPIPQVHSGTPSRAERGHHDPDMAGKVMGQAIISGSTKLPATVKEN